VWCVAAQGVEDEEDALGERDAACICLVPTEQAGTRHAREQLGVCCLAAQEDEEGEDDTGEWNAACICLAATVQAGARHAREQLGVWCLISAVVTWLKSPVHHAE
jgi:hypothetical protein